MNSIQDYVIHSLLPDSIKKDPFIVALGEAVEIELKEAYREAESMSDFSNVNALSEDLLDYIAYQKHVDFYDYTLPLETKRKLVKESAYFHRIKGTPKAVEMLIETVFGDGKVVEWFEYEGVPGYFKVITNNTSVTNELAEQFIRVLDSAKRKSAWLEKVEITQVDEMNLYIGSVVHTGDKLTLKQVN